MTDSTAIQIALNQALDDQLTTIATMLDRPKSWIIEQAITDYLALQTGQDAAIDEGIQAAERGETAPHEDVARWVRSWDTVNELPMPEFGKHRRVGRPSRPAPATTRMA